MSQNKNNDRKFVGSGTKPQNFDLINISIAKSKLEPYWYEYNGEHYVKLTVGGLREKNEYGKTHSVWINDYKPGENASKPKQTAKAPQQEPTTGDLPF